MRDGRWGVRLGVLAVMVIAAAVMTQVDVRGVTAGPSGTSAPNATWENPKLQAAQRDTPPPPRPTQQPWRAQRASDVFANLPRDANFESTMRSLTAGADPDPRAVGRSPALGTPLFVRGLRANEGDEYLVPVVVDSTTIAVMVVSLDRDGNGQLVGTRGWSSAPSFPAQNADAAIAVARLGGQPGIRAELVWTYLRGVADEMSPFWRIEREGQVISYVFENNTVISASELGIE